MAPVTPTMLLVIVAVGAGTGFLGGLFGKGGSAVATPVLVALGIPPAIALASPLPATVPATLAAARRYDRHELVDRRVLRWCLGVGLPATLVGAAATIWVSADALVGVTEVIVGAMGVGILVAVWRRRGSAVPDAAGVDGADGSDGLASESDGEIEPWLVGVVAGLVGLSAGLLANSGGFLLAPLLLLVVRLPVRNALGTSLAAAAGLAIPATIAHTALGHVDWAVVAAFAIASVPAASMGARTALRVDPHRLEPAFGAGLVVLAVGGLFL